MQLTEKLTEAQRTKTVVVLYSVVLGIVLDHWSRWTQKRISRWSWRQPVHWVQRGLDSKAFLDADVLPHFCGFQMLFSFKF